MVAESKRRKTNHETSSPGYGSRGKNGALALPESEDEEESGAPDDEESEAEPSRAPTPPPAPKETANQPRMQW